MNTKTQICFLVAFAASLLLMTMAIAAMFGDPALGAMKGIASLVSTPERRMWLAFALAAVAPICVVIAGLPSAKTAKI